MLTPEEILQFWFEDACDSPAQMEARQSCWFNADTEFDAQVWTLYSDVVTDAAADHYEDWAQTPQGRLALIIVLDQFPRNIFRGTSEAYRYDSQSLALARAGVEKGQLAGLPIPHAAFFLMPYQHSEDIQVQRSGVELMQSFVDEAPDEWRNCAAGYVDYARLHHDIVANYGRFPHRNAPLGRTSTEAESQYLRDGGHTFSQGG
jgi:uncharacterized protein (DUF924 family)